jgi:hypothetical protein
VRFHTQSNTNSYGHQFRFGNTDSNSNAYGNYDCFGYADA